MKTLQDQLRAFNRWRRSNEDMPMPDPKEVGLMLDAAADRLDVLEREHARFFKEWHDERRKREQLECRYLEAITKHTGEDRKDAKEEGGLP